MTTTERARNLVNSGREVRILSGGFTPIAGGFVTGIEDREPGQVAVTVSRPNCPDVVCVIDDDDEIRLYR